MSSFQLLEFTRNISTLLHIVLGIEWCTFSTFPSVTCTKYTKQKIPITQKMRKVACAVSKLQFSSF